MHTPEQFRTALAGFLAAAQKRVDDHNAQYSYPGAGANLILGEGGVRYLRIVKIENGHTLGSAFCFVDTTNGDVLKAAGWKAPAKGARSNIFAADFGLSGVTAYGAVYNNRR